MLRKHVAELQLYLPVFNLLHDELKMAKSLYSSGDISQAHSHLDKARILRSKISRQQRQIREFSLEDWGSRLNLTDSAIAQYLPIAQACNQVWDDISKWLNTVVGQLNHDELLRSDVGLNLLLDQQIPPCWDFNHDIIVLSGLNAELFVAPLIDRGQAQIIVIVDADFNVEVNISKPTAHATVLYIKHGDLLSADQAAALKKVEPPLMHGISSGADEQPLLELTRLARLVHKDHVVGASARRWPTVWTEQFIENLPQIIGKKSVSNLWPEIFDKDILIVSPGPSLRDSLPAIEKVRDHFVVISLIRSLPVLFGRNIRPDFAIMIDAQDHTNQGLDLIPSHPMLADVPAIVSEYTHSSSLKTEFKEFFLLPAAQLVGSPTSVALHGESPPISNGSGVASFAVSLVAELGARSISLVGQDLSVSRGSYASSDQPNLYTDEIGDLTCEGIDGSKLPTQADYLLFISELQALANVYASEVAMFNCTEHGAFLDGWEHIALDESHPVLAGGLTARALSEELRNQVNYSVSKSTIDVLKIRRGLEIEIAKQRLVHRAAVQTYQELERLISSESSDVTQLEGLEQNLLTEISTPGSMSAFYNCPAKLAAETSLQSVQSLKENFLVSLDYYGAIVANTDRLVKRLSHAIKLIDERDTEG